MMIQIESFLLHAQLRRFMMKGQKMLHYQHFQELMVTYSELKPYIWIFSPLRLLLFWINPTISIFLQQQFLLTGRLAVVRRSR